MSKAEQSHFATKGWLQNGTGIAHAFQISSVYKRLQVAFVGCVATCINTQTTKNKIIIILNAVKINRCHRGKCFSCFFITLVKATVCIILDRCRRRPSPETRCTSTRNMSVHISLALDNSDNEGITVNWSTVNTCLGMSYPILAYKSGKLKKKMSDITSNNICRSRTNCESMWNVAHVFIIISTTNATVNAVVTAKGISQI